MKRIFLKFALAGLVLSGCGSGNSADPGYSIDGIIRGAANQTLYLEFFDGTTPVSLDSLTLSKTGEFTFKMKEKLALNFYRISLSAQEYFILATDSTETPYIEADLPDMLRNYAVTGSPETSLLLDFYRTSDAYEDKMLQLRDQREVLEKSDTAALNALNKKIITGQAEYQDYLQNFVDMHSSSLAALAVLSKLDIQKDIARFKAVETGLRPRMKAHPFFVDRLAIQIQGIEQQLAQQKAQEAQEAKALKGGDAAPEITMNNPEGTPMSLSALRGKVVLLDFWASWCRPCRAENPRIVQLYNKYKNKGFDIFSVSLDQNQQKWKNAIAQDGLIWNNHVSDLAGWRSAAAALYGVRSIPFTVLLDRYGNIIATRLTGEKLEAKLAEILGS